MLHNQSLEYITQFNLYYLVIYAAFFLPKQRNIILNSFYILIGKNIEKQTYYTLLTNHQKTRLLHPFKLDQVLSDKTGLWDISKQVLTLMIWLKREEVLPLMKFWGDWCSALQAEDGLSDHLSALFSLAHQPKSKVWQSENCLERG